MLRDLSQVQRGSTVPFPQVESLGDRALLLERAAACARGAKSELLAVVGPGARDLFGVLEESRPGSRILALGAPAPAGAVVREVAAREIEAYWGGLPVAVLVDRQRAVCGILRADGGASGIATEHPGVIPFLRHLLRRELAAASPRGVP